MPRTKEMISSNPHTCYICVCSSCHKQMFLHLCAFFTNDVFAVLLWPCFSGRLIQRERSTSSFFLNFELSCKSQLAYLFVCLFVWTQGHMWSQLALNSLCSQRMLILILFCHLPSVGMAGVLPGLILFSFFC